MKILISDFDLSLYDKETDFHKTLATIEEFRKSVTFLSLRLVETSVVF